ncbi:MAG: TlpA disulfide reductase family protein [Bacteroidota bacterium]
MKKTILILLSIVATSSLAWQLLDWTPSQIAEELAKKYKRHQAVSYQVDYQAKYVGMKEDTVNIRATVHQIRLEGDTVFGRHIWIEADSFINYYNGTNNYLISIGEKKITRYTQDQDFAINGNVIGGTIQTYFDKPSKLSETLEDDKTKWSLTPSSYQNQDLIKATIQYPDEDPFFNKKYTLWVDTKSPEIIRKSFVVEFQGDTQYNDWRFRGIRYDQITPEELELKFEQFANEFTIEDYVAKTEKDYAPLADGTHFPEIEGQLMGEGKAVKLSDYLGQITILDFWYMTCFPCLSAIPGLNNLQEKYEDKGLQVIGMNPYNNNEKDIERLPTFLEHNPMSYPTFYINKDSTDSYRVFMFPTLYVLDKDGDILFTQLGHGPDVEGKLDSLIQVHLK